MSNPEQEKASSQQPSATPAPNAPPLAQSHPISSPTLQPIPVMHVPVSPPVSAPQPSIPFPPWLLQIIQIIVILVGASIALGVQREQIEQLRETVHELKATSMAREVFTVKMQEQERNNKRIEDKVDRIESLIQGIYNKVQIQGK